MLLNRNQTAIENYKTATTPQKLQLNYSDTDASPIAQPGLPLPAQSPTRPRQNVEMDSILEKHEKELLEEQARASKLEKKLDSSRETKVSQREADKLRKALAQQEKLFELLCRYVPAESVLECESAAGIKRGKEADGHRHSMDIMATLPESDDTSPGLSASSPNEAQAVCVVASLTKELACTKREEEELRKTADLCWVREQEAKRKLKELEAENRELNKYTEQMAGAHQKLFEGVKQLQDQQRTMVSEERLAQTERELQKYKEAVEREKERVSQLEQKLSDATNSSHASSSANDSSVASSISALPSSQSAPTNVSSSVPPASESDAPTLAEDEAGVKEVSGMASSVSAEGKHSEALANRKLCFTAAAKNSKPCQKSEGITWTINFDDIDDANTAADMSNDTKLAPAATADHAKTAATPSSPSPSQTLGSDESEAFPSAERWPRHQKRDADTTTEDLGNVSAIAMEGSVEPQNLSRVSMSSCHSQCHDAATSTGTTWTQDAVLASGSELHALAVPPETSEVQGQGRFSGFLLLVSRGLLVFFAMALVGCAVVAGSADGSGLSLRTASHPSLWVSAARDLAADVTELAADMRVPAEWWEEMRLAGEALEVAGGSWGGTRCGAAGMKAIRTELAAIRAQMEKMAVSERQGEPVLEGAVDETADWMSMLVSWFAPLDNWLKPVAASTVPTSLLVSVPFE